MTKGEETKSIILRKALNLASVQGLGGITIGSLALDLNMSKSGLFGKFQSKENLQIDVLKTGSELFRRRVIYPSLKAKPGIERLKVAFTSWLDWENGSELPGGCIFLASISDLDDKPGLVRDYLLKTQKEWIQILRQFLNEAQELNSAKIKKANEDANVNTDSLVQEIWGMVLSYHFYNRFLKDKKSKTQTMQIFTQFLERYFKTK
ncbi:TetR/AcrR family transcriptional regulator [Leptospira sp. GIMC2001]|uniref:TetR/AcrR family transcriptional regulator n=1 Tax=Leptospira sp. GIMC2001 TaxID=1513297 RepID=UPI00234951C1|nr:TetR family transcriptional regulator [Leptospira sp. GIMC2001]WCL50528.1 TetR family transcriptional regulator [Leptospira sp. GIMC2001]